MNDFSDDESLAFLLSAVVAASVTFRYYRRLLAATALAGGVALRAALAAVPPLCLAALLPVLLRLAAREVVADAGYVALFLLAGAGWLGLAVAIAAASGISFGDDAVDRRNPAAATALAGAMAGLTCVYAGANVGQGPTIWMTFGPAALGTLAWALAWALFQAMTGVADAVAIGRRVPPAARLAAFLILTGLLIGRAVAGDYHSAAGTFRDLARGAWPVLPLTLVMAAVERRSARPRPGRGATQ